MHQMVLRFASNHRVIWCSLWRDLLYLVSCFNRLFKNVNAI